MPRARSIKPAFFANEVLGSLPPLTRLLYIGLWTLADREGRLENRPIRIKASVLPYDSVNAEKALKDLERLGFIFCYEVDGAAYIAIPAWRKHQNPHVKEPSSTIPAPCKTGASTVQTPDQHGFSMVRKLLTPDSGLLTPDSGVGGGDVELEETPPLEDQRDERTAEREVSEMLVEFTRQRLGIPDLRLVQDLLRFAGGSPERIENWLVTKSARRDSAKSWGWFRDSGECELRQSGRVTPIKPQPPSRPADNVFDPARDLNEIITDLSKAKSL